jgi:hypothetical protein
MARTDTQLSPLAQGLSATNKGVVKVNYLTAVNGTPAAGQFRSTITGRAPMVDLSKDLGVRMGVERIQTQQIMRVDGESGPAGEAVYKPVNDKFDQMRFVGGGWTNLNNNDGLMIQSGSVAGEYLEITFYGTGLSVLTGILNNASIDWRVSVDGAAEGSNIYISTFSEVLRARNYTPNQAILLASNLTFGLHTVKLRNAGAVVMRIMGFEILNESSNLKIQPGQITGDAGLISLASQVTTPYNSGFESGTLGTRGGRVVTYLKKDGTVGKAVNPAGSQLNLTSTDHSNEEVIRNYFWREFGAGRTDDFSTLAAGPSSRAFTLDDGNTTLVGTNISQTFFGSYDLPYATTTNNFFTVTFTGTGLDLLAASSGASSDPQSVSIDGASSVGNIAATGANILTTFKIVSGLPYGTHTVKITRTNNAANAFGISNFIVYGPKKPGLPAGAVEIADYNILADFAQLGATGLETIATGTLRKYCTREHVYSGTWSAIATDANQIGTLYSRTLTASSYVEYTFCGTGFDLRMETNSGWVTGSGIEVRVDGNLVSTAGYSINHNGGGASGTPTFGTVITSTLGGAGFTPATGLLTTNGSTVNGSSLRVSGLTFGKHTVRFNNLGTTDLRFAVLDVITPIHTHKNNGPYVLQNTLAVGSQGINDSRKWGSQLSIAGNVSEAYGIQAASTTSNSYVPFADMSTTIVTKGNPIEIQSSLPVTSNLNNQFLCWAVYVDGIAQNGTAATQLITAGYPFMMYHNMIVPVSAGYHKIDIFYKLNAAGTLSRSGLSNSDSILKVREVQSV